MRTGMKSKCSAHLEVDQQLGVLRCDVPYLDNLRAWTLLRHNRRSWSEATDDRCPCGTQAATCSQPYS